MTIRYTPPSQISAAPLAGLIAALAVLSFSAAGCATAPEPSIDSMTPADGPAEAQVVGNDVVAGTLESPHVRQGVSATSAVTPDVSAETLQHYRVTEPGCCPLPFWSPDSSSVRFFFDPADGSESGLYGVSVDGGAPLFVGGEPLGTQLSGRFTTRLDGDNVELTRVADGHVWRINTDGSMLTLSADGRHAAWVEGLSNTVPGQRPPPGVNKVMDLDTEQIDTVNVPEGYLLGDWTAEGAWIATRQDRESDAPTFLRFDPASGDATELFDGARLRTGRTSPGRTWLAISRTFEDDTSQNGLYILSTDGLAEPRRLDLAGGYYWRDDHRLLVVPQEPGAASMELWQVVAATGEAELLTDPDTTPFRIAAGEWSVAPNGSHVSYRSSDDDAIWVMRLPDPR